MAEAVRVGDSNAAWQAVPSAVGAALLAWFVHRLAPLRGPTNVQRKVTRVKPVSSHFIAAASRRLVAWAGAVLAGAASVLGGDVHLDMLRTRTGAFTNVTVVSQSRTDLFIRHARGIANVKISQIEDEAALRALGLYVEPPPQKKPSPVASAGSALAPLAASAKLPAQTLGRAEQQLDRVRSLAAMAARQPARVLALWAGVTLAVYLFFCHCLALICRKAGRSAGPLIWVPVLQALPLFRAAQMSPWWLLACLVPIANVIVSVVWCFRIVRARGKSVLTAVALLLPGLNVLALLYLAFSDGARPETQERVASARESLVFET